MDELTDGYRRASAEQAGRPSAAARAAILAEARAQAAARAAPAAANASRFVWRAAASVVIAGFGLLLWREVSRTPEAARQVVESTGAAAPRATDALPKTAFTPPPPQDLSRDARRLATSQQSPEAVLQRRFPEAMAAQSPPAGVWLLEDAGGRIVRSGALQPGEDFGGVTRELQTAFPQRRVGAFSVRTARNAHGRPVQVAVARLDCQDAQDASFCAQLSR